MAVILHHTLLFFHIFLAIVWVGGILFIGWGIYPAAKTLSRGMQQQFFLSLMRRTHWILTAAGIGVILSGVLLGTVAGPLRHWQNVWDTTYGQIWFSALLISVATLLWGVFIGYRKSIKVLSDSTLWKKTETGDMQPSAKPLITIVVVESVEVFGFLILIALMTFL